MKPNGLTIGSRSNPHEVFAIVICFAGDFRTASANMPFAAVAEAAVKSPALIKLLLFIVVLPEYDGKAWEVVALITSHINTIAENARIADNIASSNHPILNNDRIATWRL